MVSVINPKVDIVGFGPSFQLESGEVITSDEFVHAASQVTYKGMEALDEVIRLKSESADISEQVTKGTIGSVGRGHASASTTPGIWMIMGGESSKLVDAIFTGARFGSSLMPSGRRVGINKDQIVIPKAIHGIKLAEEAYLRVSEANIAAYDKLQANGVSQQEAAKIVHYGLKGGGFAFMPLETLVYFAREFENEATRHLVPDEGVEVVRQLEEFIRKDKVKNRYISSLHDRLEVATGEIEKELKRLTKKAREESNPFTAFQLSEIVKELKRNSETKIGLKTVYEARKVSPRGSYVNPSIFHNRVNHIQELIDSNAENVLYEPVLMDVSFLRSPEMDARVQEYLLKRQQVCASQVTLKKGWRELLYMGEKLADDFNLNSHITTIANVSMRVWGEDKRHRTVPQIVESIYHAIDRAAVVVNEFGGDYSDLKRVVEHFTPVVSIPRSVASNTDNLKLWIETFSNAIRVIKQLEEIVDLKDIAAMVPRGIKVGIEKSLDFYNTYLGGFMPTRLCGTVEPEMRETTEKERDLILASPEIPTDVKKLIGPKCYAVGFCLEPGKNYASCKRVNVISKGYSEEFHKHLTERRAEDIRVRLK